MPDDATIVKRNGICSMQGFIWAGLFIGSMIGGWIPTLWGADMFSVSGILLSAVGGAAGIWVGYRIGKYIL